MLEAVEVNDIDFAYGYVILRAYFFKIRTNIDNEVYPNEEYARLWRDYFKRVDFDSMLRKAFELISVPPKHNCLNFYDCLTRSAYFALIHKDHPNITLGFLKDADLWDLWLREGVFKVARERIAEIISPSDGDRILDLGCGSVSPSYYAELVGPNGIYTGVDFSKPLLGLARERVKEERLDWVNLKQEYVDSRLHFKRAYDFVICSSILQYADLKATLRNAVEALRGEGTIVVFSEVFRDLEPEKAELFELYYRLIPNFKGFPSVSGIIDYLSKFCEFKYNLIDRNFLKIEVKDII